MLAVNGVRIIPGTTALTRTPSGPSSNAGIFELCRRLAEEGRGHQVGVSVECVWAFLPPSAGKPAASERRSRRYDRDAGERGRVVPAGRVEESSQQRVAARGGLALSGGTGELEFYAGRRLLLSST